MTITHDFDNPFGDDYLKELEEKPQPEACSIDNPDCENCGS